MTKHIIISLLIFIFAVMPMSVLAIPCLVIALLTKWDGRGYFFGNSKWGRATTHYLAPTNGSYLKELSWLGFRNPICNFKLNQLGANMRQNYHLFGNGNIGDRIAGGFYYISMRDKWEYYYIKPYEVFGSKRCVRLRAGWKIKDNVNKKAEFVFAFNPWKLFTKAG